MGIDPHYPETITPPDRPLGWIRGIPALADNPVQTWPRHLYEGRYTYVKFRGKAVMNLVDPTLIGIILKDQADKVIKHDLQRRTLEPALGEGLIMADGSKWRAQRRAASPAFRHQALESLVPAMAQSARDVSGRLLAGPADRAQDVMPEMMHATFDIIVAALFEDGGEFDAQGVLDDITLYLATQGHVGVLDIFDAPLWTSRLANRKGIAAAKRMRAAVRENVRRQAARDEPSDTLSGQLLRATDPKTGERLTETELVDNLLTFVAAGHETTALALTWTLGILARLPELQDRLAEEARSVCGEADVAADDIDRLPLHNRVLQESMRLFPPAPVAARMVTEPFEVADKHLVPGDMVNALIYPLHRHVKWWDDPNRFDPDRFLPENAEARDRYAYIPFGGGPHICIGMRFAMMEAAVILARLVRDCRFAPQPDHRFHPVLRITLRPKGGMPLFVSPR
ncbi:MAG: cytochrome P450 [Euryhalocaulis sp.]|uniref:cytochrome P450 n=1 Tax=Euryhalocaulis sp. TaxID=2744307 RepID=UPI0017D2A368|nr:cytochrome P450 [Euryhalocaulis sp.]MBA4801410.1 cytochrome P450 [Euryhalocaulis sp.]